MKLAVLSSPQSWYWRDLRRAAEASGESIELAFFSRLADRIGMFRTRCDAAAPAGRSQAQSQRTNTVYGSPDDGPQPLNADVLLVRTMPPGSLEQVVFRMDVLHRMQAQGTCVVNSPRALEAAVDKYLSLFRLEAQGLPVPDTIVCQTAEQALAAFEQLAGNVVVKPLFGSEGRGMLHVTDLEMARRVFRAWEELRFVIYVQRFIHHPGYDLRVLWIGDDAFCIKRSHDQWRTNVSQGGRAESHPARPELLDLAAQARNAIEAPLAGVDLICDNTGQWYVLEVNAVPGWRAVASTLQVDIAQRIIHYLKDSWRRGA